MIQIKKKNKIARKVKNLKRIKKIFEKSAKMIKKISSLRNLSKEHHKSILKLILWNL